MAKTPAETKLDEIRVLNGVQEDDVTILSTEADENLEAVIGQAKGRPKHLLIDPAGVVLRHGRL
jgi:hypothetical protein